jgi:hypothetical protein
MSLPIIQQQQLLQLAVDSKIITIILLESLLCPARVIVMSCYIL